MSANKYLCCSLNLTIASRLIASIGIAVSILLATVLLKDTHVGHYAVSRDVALAFGLDWRHLHPNASTSHESDPDGKMISMVMIVYSVLFFAINVGLLFATIAKSKTFAYPWLFCEAIGCSSKFAALIYHLIAEFDDLSNIFIIGSVLYIVVIIWWWFVVYYTQTSWPKQESLLELSELMRDDLTNTSIINDSALNPAMFAYTTNYNEIYTPFTTNTTSV